MMPFLQPSRDSVSRQHLLVQSRPERAVKRLDPPAIDPSVHAVAVEFQLMRPAVALRCFRDELRELRADERRRSGASKMPDCRGSRFFGTIARLATASPAGRLDLRF
jgi:hypothetical protein